MDLDEDKPWHQPLALWPRPSGGFPPGFAWENLRRPGEAAKSRKGPDLEGGKRVAARSEKAIIPGCRVLGEKSSPRLKPGPAARTGVKVSPWSTASREG